MMGESKSALRLSSYQTLLAYVGIMLVWTLAWVLKTSVIDKNIPWLTTDAGSFVWWTIAKVLIWILPALWLIRRSGRTLKEVFNVAHWKSALVWGGGIGVLAALTALIPAYQSGHRFLLPTFSFPLVNVLVIAPIFEEFLARGALLGNLQKSFSFWIANVVSALMFLGMHIPGWYFAGSLVENMTHPIGGALSIFLLGLVFGYAVYKSHSVMGGMLAHFLNNLAQSV